MKSMQKSAQQTVVTKKYKILGKGGFGMVWLVDYRKRVPVTDENPNGWSKEIPGAAKIMHLKESDILSGKDLRESVDELLEEMRTLQHLTNFNKNMVHLIDAICVPDSQTHFPFSTIVILMELCHGNLITLCDISGPYIGYQVCRKWMRNITNALLYMHSRNAVHLDIKPDNIMFQRVKDSPPLTKDVLMREYKTITFKLGDFGFCEIYDSDETAFTTVNAGTRDYQSPELQKPHLREAGVKSKPCDIYSLGMTLAFCLMPESEFDRLRTTNTMQKRIAVIVSGHDPNPNPNITPELAYLIYDMLHTDPRRRLTINQLSKKLWLTRGVSKRTLPVKDKNARYQWFLRRDNKRQRIN